MRAALIDDDGLVVNVIEYDPDTTFEPDGGLALEVLGDEPVGPGWRRDGDTWTAPAVEVQPAADTTGDPIGELLDALAHATSLAQVRAAAAALRDGR